MVFRAMEIHYTTTSEDHSGIGRTDADRAVEGDFYRRKGFRGPMLCVLAISSFLGRRWAAAWYGYCDQVGTYEPRNVNSVLLRSNCPPTLHYLSTTLRGR